MADLIVATINTRFISNANWEGTDKNIPDFDDLPVELTANETLVNVTKAKINQAIEQQNNHSALTQICKSGEQPCTPAFGVETSEDPNEITVFLFDYISDEKVLPIMRCLITKCNCCDDMNLTMNLFGENLVNNPDAVPEFMERAHILTVAWGELVKEAENRNIQ